MDNLSRGVAFFIFLIGVGATSMSPADFISASEKIDINTAPSEELIKIVHIGEARALELISLRPFSSLDDLAKINGISVLRVEDIKKQGLAWIDIKESTELDSQEAEDVAEEQPRQYPEGIIFNEILPSPEGLDEENEWIEIYNKNILRADISDWQIKDEKGKTKTYSFPEETFIEGGQFLVLLRTVSGITLNNEGDELSLLWPSGQITDSVSYEKAPRGQSYSKTSSGWTWGVTLTLGSTNIVPAPKTRETGLLEEIVEKSEEKGPAAIGEAFGQERRKQLPVPSSTLLIALAAATFSGIIILVLKRESSS